MPRPLLASALELSQRVGRPANDQRLVAALQDASRRFRSAVHHEVSRVDGDVLELNGTGGKIIFLPARPIVSIESLVWHDEAATVLELGVDFSVQKNIGVLRRLGGYTWPAADGFATLTYTHGYDATVLPSEDAAGNPAGSIPGLPDDIQAAVLDMAQVLLNVEAGVQSRTVLGDTVQYGAAAAVGATQVWSDAVDNHAIARGDRA